MTHGAFGRGVILSVLLVLFAQPARAESLVAFLPYSNATDSEQIEHSLLIVDLSVGLVAEELHFEGRVRNVDVVDELGTVYVTILSEDDTETRVLGLDLQTRQVVFETQLPGLVLGVHVDAETGRLYATDRYAQELIEIDLSGAGSWRHPTGGAFHTIQPVRNSRFLMVSGDDSSRIWDMDERAFLDVELGRYRMPLLSDDGDTLYGAHMLNGRVSKLNFRTGELLGLADAGVFWPRVELPESDSRIRFISGVAAGKLDFDSGGATMDFGLADIRFPSVLTTHNGLIVMAEPREVIICPPLLPCDDQSPPASILMFDRDDGNLIREVEMPAGGVVVTFGRVLSETARGAPQPASVPAIGSWGLVAMTLLMLVAAGRRWLPAQGLSG